MATVIVAVAVAGPLVLVAVSVYVVVDVGIKVRVPVADTVPTPGVILTVVAPVTVHDSVVLSPAVMDAGLVVKAVMTGKPAVEIVTVADAVELPALLVAVRV